MLAEQLDGAVCVVAGLLSGLETAALSGEEAEVLARGFSRLVRLGEAGMALCARRVADVGFHERLGHPSAESFLEQLAGRPARGARSLLETAGSLAGLPGLESALRAGELSCEQAAEVARGASAEPSLLPELLETAREGSLRKLRSATDRLEAAARSREEDEARHARLRAERHLRTWNDPDGSLRGRFSLPPEEGAHLLSALSAEAERRFQQARGRGSFERREAYLADALCGLAAGAPAAARAGGRLEGTILFHVSLEALLRGHLEAGEECALSSGAHVPLSLVEGYLARSRLRLVVWRGEDVCSVVSLKRSIPASVETALVARDRTCVVPGCSSTFLLEIDHIVPFSLGGPTRLSNLARLCRAHHAMKSEKGWRLEGTPGHWRWLPPIGPPPGAGRRRGRSAPQDVGRSTSAVSASPASAVSGSSASAVSASPASRFSALPASRSLDPLPSARPEAPARGDDARLRAAPAEPSHLARPAHRAGDPPGAADAGSGPGIRGDPGPRAEQASFLPLLE